MLIIPKGIVKCKWIGLQFMPGMDILVCVEFLQGFSIFSPYVLRIMPETPVPILLFIDDDEAYLSVARHILSNVPGSPFNVICRHDAATALEELRTNKAIDLIILDHYLPEVEGFALLKQIRQQGFSTPVMLLTSQREFRLAIEALRYGVEDYLLKDDAVGPVLPRTILNVLERTKLKRQIAEQQKVDLITRKQTDAIRELVVTVCHEFNNPLAAIKISTDIVMRQLKTEEERRIGRELDICISHVEEEIQLLREINFE
jgi:response regulator of citrate/malate metabolism